LPDLKSARAAHPHGHISWGHGCFYAGYPHKRHREVARRPPVPQSRPALAPAVPMRQILAERVVDVAPPNSFEDRWRAVYGLPNSMRQQLEVPPWPK